MHAFDYPNMYGFRFIFLLVFLMVTLACRQFPYMKASHIKTLCIYSGGDTGFEERDAILEYLKKLPPKQYVVIKNEYFNRGNNPPMPVFVFKN